MFINLESNPIYIPTLKYVDPKSNYFIEHPPRTELKKYQSIELSVLKCMKNVRDRYNSENYLDVFQKPENCENYYWN